MNNSTVSVVLIVEDDEATRLMMSITLKQAGFQVLEAGNCASARALFYAQPVNVVLLDVLPKSLLRNTILAKAAICGLNFVSNAGSTH